MSCSKYDVEFFTTFRENYNNYYDKKYYFLDTCKKYLKNYYHIIVHKSMIPLFFDGFISRLHRIYIGPLWCRDDHVHIILQCLEKNYLNFPKAIHVESIYTKQHLKFIINNFVKHLCEFLCTKTFNLVSLQDRALDVLVSNLRYFRDIEQFFPPVLLKNIFEKAKFYFQIPIHNTHNYCLDMNNFLELDQIYEKNYVAWFRTLEDAFCPDNRFILVRNVFVNDRGDFFNVCRNCIKFEKQNVHRHFYWSRSTWSAVCPSRWCHTCKQTNLFQIFKWDQFIEQYSSPDPLWEGNLLKIEYSDGKVEKWIPKD